MSSSPRNLLREREWMYKRLDHAANHGFSDEFVQGLKSFFFCVAQNDKSYIEKETILCPCSRCKNMKRKDANTVSRHLYSKGFTDNYYLWTSHGESIDSTTSAEQPEPGSQRFLEMLARAKGPLYEGCKEGLSPLSMITRLMELKTTYDLSEDCMDDMIEFIDDILPRGHKAPKSYYEAEILMKLFGMPPN